MKTTDEQIAVLKGEAEKRIDDAVHKEVEMMRGLGVVLRIQSMDWLDIGGLGGTPVLETHFQGVKLRLTDAETGDEIGEMGVLS